MRLLKCPGQGEYQRYIILNVFFRGFGEDVGGGYGRGRYTAG